MLPFQRGQHAGALEHRPQLDLQETAGLPNPRAGGPPTIDVGLGALRTPREKLGDADQFHSCR